MALLVVSGIMVGTAWYQYAFTKMQYVKKNTVKMKMTQKRFCVCSGILLTFEPFFRPTSERASKKSYSYDTYCNECCLLLAAINPLNKKGVDWFVV
jgi:hypothetical protein